MNELEQAWNKLKDEVNASNVVICFNTGAIVANHMLYGLKTTQNTLLDTVSDIYHGRFNFHLLPPERELSVISTQLNKDMTLPVDSIRTELRKIYERLRFKTRLLDNVLIFEMKLPLVSRDIYGIFKLSSIPEEDQGKALSVTPISEYISINMKKDTYCYLKLT